MATQFDETDFIDRDYQAAQQTTSAAARSSLQAPRPAPVPVSRPPSREELESRVSETHNRLTELRRAQEVLERERAALEESHRRRAEFQTGREEMLEQLTRGLGILEESELAARRATEQMARTLDDFRAAIGKLSAIHEEEWTEESYTMELTRALTTIENARMEWNSARVKFPVLTGESGGTGLPAGATPSQFKNLLATHSMAELAKLGLALTWPLAAVTLLSLIIFLYLALNR